MLFNIFNVRLAKVGWVDAVDVKDALKHALIRWPGAAVEQVLTEQQRRQKRYKEEVELWESMNPGYRR